MSTLILTPFKFIEYLRIKLFIGIFWRERSKRLVDSIELFSATEADTVWQLVHGIDKISEPKARAEIFAQILEEDHHAAVFKGLFNQFSDRPFNLATYEREYLYTEKDEVWKLLAYCYVGEDEATEKFKNIYRSTDNVPLKVALKSIIQDESGHVQKAFRLLKEMGVSDQALNKEIFRIKISRRFATWMRVGKRAANLPANVMLTMMYYVLGIFCYLPTKSRIAKRLFKNKEHFYEP